MLGVGVGFDTLGAGRVTVWGPNERQTKKQHVIPDSREGWVESVRYLIDAYFLNLPLPAFDYTEIRPAGRPIKGFGGVSQVGRVGGWISQSPIPSSTHPPTHPFKQGGEILQELHGERKSKAS